MGAADPFDAPGLAEGYATARPPLHGRILARAMPAAGWAGARGFGLDAGCGAGLSTGAMRAFVDRAAGMDPVVAMAAQAARRMPDAWFFAARAEQLPLCDGACDLITAAGSLNYCDVRAALAELARVLAPEGRLVVYDFAPGRRFRDGADLEDWFAGFLLRYPKPDDGAVPLDPQVLASLAGAELLPVAGESFGEAVTFDAAGYAAYLMTETNVAAAVRAGQSPSQIRAWMDGSLSAVFRQRPRDVVFDCYFAVFAKPSSSSTRVAP